MPPPDATSVYQSMIPRYSGLKNAFDSATQYIAGQAQNVQQLQLQQAQDLSKFKTLDQVYYGGAHTQQLDAMLAQNPYGRHLVSPPQGGQQGLGNAGQPMSGSPSVGANMINAPGGGGYGMLGPLPSPSVPNGSPGGGVPMSGVNPIGPGGMVSTGGSVTGGGMEPPKFSQSFTNPQGEAATAAAKEQATGNVAIQKAVIDKLLENKVNRTLYPNNPFFGSSKNDAIIDELLSKNPYSKQVLDNLQSGKVQPTGQPFSMSSVNPLNSGGNVTTGGTVSIKGPQGEMNSKTVNLPGTTAEEQAKEQGRANVAPQSEFGTKMAGQRALAQENLARDSSQMTAVFATLKNLHDIHGQLTKSNLAGTDLGDLANENLGHVGTAAAILGQKPADWQNSLVSPENQSLIGQFQAGRNEGITRAIQPLQNQVDKTGSSRIMDSLLNMTQGEYGSLDDPQGIYDGKTIGTAKTLYRITLASQNYADQLKAKGIKLDGNDPHFNPDVIASHIYNQAQGIQFSSAQAKDFNGYANQIMGTKGTDYSGVLPKQGSQNPVMNQTKQQPMQGNKMPKFNPATQKVQQNTRTGEYRVVNL